MESECRILLEVICMYGWTVGQPESKLSGQLRCTALLPSSSNFLKPNIPSPKIGLLIGNYEVYCILDKIGALHWTVIGCYHSSAMLSDSLIRLTLARLHKNVWRLESQSNPNWRLFMGLFIEGDFQVPINHWHYDQMDQSGCATSVDVQGAWIRYMDVKNYEVCFIYCKYSIYEVP